MYLCRYMRYIPYVLLEAKPDPGPEWTAISLRVPWTPCLTEGSRQHTRDRESARKCSKQASRQTNATSRPTQPQPQPQPNRADLQHPTRKKKNRTEATSGLFPISGWRGCNYGWLLSVSSPTTVVPGSVGCSKQHCVPPPPTRLASTFLAASSPPPRTHRQLARTPRTLRIIADGWLAGLGWATRRRRRRRGRRTCGRSRRGMK